MSQTTSSTAPTPLFTKRRPPELNFGRPGSQSNLSSFPKSHYPPSPALPSPANYDYPMPSPLGRRRPSSRSPLAPPNAPSMASKPSSSTLYQSAMANQSDRRLKSQYPRDSAENHVEFILVASFDIDKGPIMEHQYPAPISGDESMLAELMLPEGTHNRAQDWTIFFLHKDAASDDNPDTPGLPDRPSSRRRGDDDASSVNGSLYNADEYNDDETVDGPPLIYVLNLVNTKHDPTVKRGAVVKAMAICTRHPFLHIYKPLLLLALEEYFRSPTIENLASLYQSVNSMDLSSMPKLSLLERIILQASTAKDLFVERFEAMIEARKAEDAAERDGREIAKYMVPRDTHEFESKIVYNGIAVPVKIPTARSTETVGDFSIIKLIQTFSAPHASSPQPFAVHPHLTTGGPNTHPIIVLVNAMITQKRIIFLGHNRPSGEVAEAVLAACALASGGLLRGFTRHAFPYTDLTKVDELLKVPGFVAGVTNPAFANKPEWWDLLCDLPSGRMKISSKIDPAPLTDGLASFQQQNPSAVNLSMNPQHLQAQDYTGDAAFMDSVQRNISNRLGEGVIRSMWRDWIVKLTRIAAAFEEIVYGASALYIGGDQADQGEYGLSGHGYVWSDEASRQRELAGNISRIEGWRATRSYYSFKQDLIHLWNSRPIRTVDLHHHHDRLRSHKLQKDDSAAIYLGFSAMIHTEAEISQLLTVTSESHGGLFFISLGLLHPRKDVRYKTVELLDKVQTHEAGKHFWETLGRFAKFAFYRIKREKEQGEGDTGLSRTTTLMGQTSVESA